jgi:hypothetical protein
VSLLKRSVASFFILLSSRDITKPNGPQAGLRPSAEQQALYLVPMEGSDECLAQSAPVMAHVSSSAASNRMARLRNEPPPKGEMLPLTCLGRCDGILLQQVL